MASRKKLRIGLDLDGVVACHLWGGLWVVVRKFKEKVLRKTHTLRYYFPSTSFERWSWKIINGARKPFSDKDNFFSSVAGNNEVELYLVTSRFKFLEELTRDWLRKFSLDKNFREISINTKDLDPSLFKANIIRKSKIDFFVDDDLETINYLKEKTRAKLFWVVPGHRNKKDNNSDGIESCSDLLDALRKIVR